MTAMTISRSRRCEEGMENCAYNRVACDLNQKKKLIPKCSSEVRGDVFPEAKNSSVPGRSNNLGYWEHSALAHLIQNLPNLTIKRSKAPNRSGEVGSRGQGHVIPDLRVCPV